MPSPADDLSNFLRHPEEADGSHYAHKDDQLWDDDPDGGGCCTCGVSATRRR